MDNVTDLSPWESVKFSWGTAVRHRKGRWTNVFLFPDAQEINVEHLDVILHENGIEFIPNTNKEK
jgi:hypothetical protein